MFAIRSNNVHGEAPPFRGNARPNTDFVWYYLFSDRTVKFVKLRPMGELIEAWASCGLMVRLDLAGRVVYRGVADSYRCPELLHLLPLPGLVQR